MYVCKLNFTYVRAPDLGFWIIYIPLKLLFSPNELIYYQVMHI